MPNLYGGLGMGSAGMGAGMSPMTPAMARLSPQALAMMQAMVPTAGIPQPVQPQGAPPGVTAAPTPMANFIGALPQGNPAVMQHPMMPPVAANPMPQAVPDSMQQMAGTAQNAQQVSQLMQKLGAGQTGVLPAAQNPEGMSFLQRLLSGFQGAVPPAGGMT